MFFQAPLNQRISCVFYHVWIAAEHDLAVFCADVNSNVSFQSAVDNRLRDATGQREIRRFAADKRNKGKLPRVFN